MEDISKEYYDTWCTTREGNSLRSDFLIAKRCNENTDSLRKQADESLKNLIKNKETHLKEMKERLERAIKYNTSSYFSKQIEPLEKAIKFLEEYKE